MRTGFPQLLLLLAAISGPVPAQSANFDVWFGTSTSRTGPSKGIYYGEFDSGKGELSKPVLAFEISSPGFLAMHPGGKVLYSTGSLDGEACAVAYAINETARGKSLTLINSHPIGDGGAAHLSTDRSGKFLMTAQYGGGSTAMFELASNGSIVRRVGIYDHGAGSGVVARRQDKSHAHWVGTSPDNQFAFVPDLGMDKVVIWRLDQDLPALKPHGFGVCPPGGGPRHMKFHPSGKFIYVLNELSLSVTAFRYSAIDGAMEAFQTLPTVPEDQKNKENFNSSSEIRMHPTGKFVYAANRGNDTISVFQIDQGNGEMTFVQREPIRGSWPRNFNIDPTGKWLIAAGKDSNTATIFNIDQAAGTLRFMTHRSVYVPSSICVLFGR